jgi:hypothetical protein
VGENVLKTFEEYMKEIVDKILATVQKQRMDKELVSHIYEDVESRIIDYVWKKSGADREEPLPEGGTLMILAPFETEAADVVHIRIKVKGDFITWFRNQENYIIDPYVEEIGRLVAAHEAAAIIQGLIKEAKEFPVTSDRPAKPEVMKASEWIRNNKHYADTLVINPEHQVKLVENNEILERWLFPLSLWDKKGSHFCGIMDGIEVYWTPHIAKDVSLLYEKSQACLKRTPIVIKFDDPNNPANLLIEEDCVAWSVDNNAISKICLKPKQ